MTLLKIKLEPGFLCRQLNEHLRRLSTSENFNSVERPLSLCRYDINGGLLAALMPLTGLTLGLSFELNRLKKQLAIQIDKGYKHPS